MYFSNARSHQVLSFLLIVNLVGNLHAYAADFKVKGKSMEPTLKDGEIVHIYYANEIKKGDIISFNISRKRHFTKRAYAVFGDKVTYENKIIYVNGKKAMCPQGNIINATFDEWKRIKRGLDKSGKVKNKQYIVFSDNPKNRFDSRAYGPIRLKHINGVIEKKSPSHNH